MNLLELQLLPMAGLDRPWRQWELAESLRKMAPVHRVDSLEPEASS